MNDNPSATLPYSDEDIELYRNGKDPIGHPNTNWYDEVFKKNAMETQHSLSVSGGSETTTYMASVAYLFQDGLSQEKNYERYNGRVNLDSKIAKWINLGINASAYLNNDNYRLPYILELLVKYGLNIAIMNRILHIHRC